MLSGTRFGYQPPLAHAAGKQCLSDTVVDFVSARMQQVFALEPDLRPAHLPGQPLSEVERRRPPGIVPKEGAQFGLKLRILASLMVSLLEFFERRHQNLRYITTAIRSE